MPPALKRFGVFLFAVASLVASARGSTILDFEGIADGTSVDSIYLLQGAQFTNALVISAGISLNELEFPPHSGQNVATDSGGLITITFAAPVTSFSAYFTYSTTLQLAAFDASSLQVDSANSAFTQNFVSSGNAPDELIALSYAAGFDSVTITGDPAGGSFVMDDVVYDTSSTPPVSVVPEPGGIALASLGILAIISSAQIQLQHWKSTKRWKSTSR